MPLLYWIAPNSNPYDSTNYWSLSSGGPSAGIIPGLSHTIVFDASGPGTCILSTDTTVAGISVTSDFTGIFIDHSSNLVCTDASFLGGHLFSYGKNFQVSNLLINGTRFTSTEQALSIDGTSDIREPVGPVAGSTTEIIPLTDEDATNKSLFISQAPDVRVPMSLSALGGIPQRINVDWDYSGMKIDWSGRGLDGELFTGSVIEVTYAPQPAGFYNHRGTMSFNGPVLKSAGTNYYDLTLSNVAGTTIDGSAYIENSLNLPSGYLIAGSDSTLHAQGDIIIGSSFGQRNSSVHIIIDASKFQDLVYESGAVIPFLTIAKDGSSLVKAYGSGPITVDGNLTITSGTFDTNGLSIQVGT